MDLYNTIREMPMFENFSEEEIEQFARMDLLVRRFRLRKVPLLLKIKSKTILSNFS